MPLKHKPDSHGVQIHVELCLTNPLLGMRAGRGSAKFDKTFSQDLANQGKKLFAALALMVRLPNV